MWPLISLRAYLAAGVAIALAAALFMLDRTAYRRGWAAAAAKQLERDREAIDRAHARMVELEAAVRQEEADRARVLSEVSSAYEAKLTEAQADNERVRGLLARGDVRLRFPAARPADSAGGASAAAAGPAGGCDGREAGELPRAIALDLWQLAVDADRDAEQLAACQAVIRADRGHGG